MNGPRPTDEELEAWRYEALDHSGPISYHVARRAIAWERARVAPEIAGLRKRLAAAEAERDELQAWGVIITEYPDEGCMGPYPTREMAEEAARTNLGEGETTAVVRLPLAAALTLAMDISKESFDHLQAEIARLRELLMDARSFVFTGVGACSTRDQGTLIDDIDSALGLE